MNAANNTLLHEYSYDAWGRMRNTANLTTYSPGSEPVLFVAGRGFTGHEHLPWFNLINMNGRLYDPLTAQFLSPDNYVQDPTFTQNYNRYIYCLNNPLKYVDPSGYKQLKSWEEFWEVINNLMDYGGSWNSETGYSDGRQGGSIEGYGVLSGSGFHGPGQPYMLGEVTITAQAPEKNTPTTPIIDNNNDPFRFDKNDPAGQGGREPIIGLSVDATLAIASLGYTVEGGFYTNGKESSQFVSHGQTFGVEASAGFNFILIKPKDNFKFSDLEGMGTSGVINFWILSISVLGNSSPGYPENSVFDTYWGIKIGIGPGAGGSYTPNSNTSFHDWIPDYSQSFFHWR